MTLPDPAGGDVGEAIRNLNLEDAVGTALTGEQAPAPSEPPAPSLPNRKRFDGFTQGLAGTLLAEDDKLKRARADLDQQLEDASSEQDATIAAAKRVYDAAVADAAALYLARKEEINEKIDDNVKAVGSIQSAITALTA